MSCYVTGVSFLFDWLRDIDIELDRSCNCTVTYNTALCFELTPPPPYSRAQSINIRKQTNLSYNIYQFCK